jgi:hypothetical protein
MSVAEFVAMCKTGRVQESFSGTTHVLWPPDASGFLRQAKPGSVYVEFDVPDRHVRTTGAGWAKIIGPNSLEGRIARRKGQPIQKMPKASNIRHIASRLD